MVSESVQTERDHVAIAEWIHRRVTLRRLEHTAPRPATKSNKEKDHLLERLFLFCVRQYFSNFYCPPTHILHLRNVIYLTAATKRVVGQEKYPLWFIINSSAFQQAAAATSRTFLWGGDLRQLRINVIWGGFKTYPKIYLRWRTLRSTYL